MILSSHLGPDGAKAGPISYSVRCTCGWQPGHGYWHRTPAEDAFAQHRHAPEPPPPPPADLGTRTP